MGDTLKAKLDGIKGQLQTALADLKTQVEPKLRGKLDKLEEKAVKRIDKIQEKVEKWRAERGESPVIEEPAQPPTTPEPEPTPTPEPPDPNAPHPDQTLPGDLPPDAPPDLPVEQDKVDELRSDLDDLQTEVSEGLAEIRAEVDTKIAGAVEQAQSTVLTQIDELRATIEGNLPPHIEHH